jgi:hypothetical protein
MSNLVRLYPAAWRERYEEEFLVVLETRPPTFGDRFDILRGAVDARLHPQVRRSAEAPVPTDERAADLVIARRLGIGAIIGGAIWVAAWCFAINGPVVGYGDSSYRDGQAAIPLYLLAVGLLVGGLVGELILLPSTARLARVGAILGIPFLILWTLSPWSLPEFLAMIAALLTLGIGAIRAKAWGRLTGAIVVGSLIVLSLVVVPAFSGLLPLPQEAGMVFAAVLGGLIWLGVGGSLIGGVKPVDLRPA